MTKWTHNGLAHDLAEHLRQNTSRFVWEDMQLGPSGSPRPDVYAVPYSFSKFCPVAYECKISVSDFRADVTKGKYTSYIPFASGIVFAVPEGLIKKADLPAGCGLMVRGESGWRTLKGPTMSAVDNLPRDAWIKLLIDGIKRESQRSELKARVGHIWATEKELSKRHGEEVARLVCDAYSSAERLRDAVANQEAVRAAIFRETEEERKRRQESLDKAIGRLNDAQMELAETLGLPDGATIPQLTRAIYDARNRLAEDAEIQRFRSLFSSLERVIAQGKTPLPGEGVA
ncbi:hypothetical protein J8655_07985 [Dickeya oryzae]|uniref:hypothetical protein n=1 Tax=Dickeya oryzae TaxID=1240404 RepID=UPI001AECAB3E|nr:hypothetical protein [Dickeya oryzae]MBP2845414.1 hypothetical protein [Dickeya oryzae]